MKVELIFAVHLGETKIKFVLKSIIQMKPG